MKDTFIERLREEKDNLSTKITKLNTFIISSGVYPTLSLEHRTLLLAQLKSMESYLYILEMRLVLLEPRYSANE